MIPHVITATGRAVSLLCDDHQQPAATISLTASPAVRQLTRINSEPTPPLSPSSLAIPESAPPPPPNYQHLATTTATTTTLGPYHNSSSSQTLPAPPIPPPYAGQSTYPYRRPTDNYSATPDGGQYNNNNSSYTYASPPQHQTPVAPNQSQQQWYAPSQESQPLPDKHQYYQPPIVPYQPSARSVSPLPPIPPVNTTSSGPSIPTPPSTATSPRRQSHGSKMSPSPSPATTTAEAAAASTAAAGPAGEQARKPRRYTCHCGKSFTTSGHLARHMRIHTGEKNYVCPEKGCGARFSRQDNCMQHYRTHQTQGTKRHSVALSTGGPVRSAAVSGVANPSVIQAARKRRSSHPGILEGNGSNGSGSSSSGSRRAGRQVAAASAIVSKGESNRTHHQHRHSVDYTSTTAADYGHHHSQSFNDPSSRYTAADRSPPRLLPLPSPQQAPYQPPYSPHSQYSPQPPPAVHVYESSHYHAVAPPPPLQQQSQDMQYQAQSPAAAFSTQQHPSSLHVPVTQTSPSSGVDPASDAISRLDELASIATQVAV
ncbi:hypothetical protein V1509DRAFT_619852 [Lipomyces kononenkoae]